MNMYTLWYFVVQKDNTKRVQGDYWSKSVPCCVYLNLVLSQKRIFAMSNVPLYLSNTTLPSKPFKKCTCFLNVPIQGALAKVVLLLAWDKQT